MIRIGKMPYKTYRKGVFCVVYSGEKYLLLHRKLHWSGWEFPKGGLLANERYEHAVTREVKEETGLKVTNLKKFSFKGKFVYDKKTRHERKVKGFSYVLFGCGVRKARVKISKREHDNFKWMGYSGALKSLKWKNQRNALKIVNRYNKI